MFLACMPNLKAHGIETLGHPHDVCAPGCFRTLANCFDAQPGALPTMMESQGQDQLHAPTAALACSPVGANTVLDGDMGFSRFWNDWETVKYVRNSAPHLAVAWVRCRQLMQLGDARLDKIATLVEGLANLDAYLREVSFPSMELRNFRSEKYVQMQEVAGLPCGRFELQAAIDSWRQRSEADHESSARMEIARGLMAPECDFAAVCQIGSRLDSILAIGIRTRSQVRAILEDMRWIGQAFEQAELTQQSVAKMCAESLAAVGHRWFSGEPQLQPFFKRPNMIVYQMQDGLCFILPVEQARDWGMLVPAVRAPTNIQDPSSEDLWAAYRDRAQVLLAQLQTGLSALQEVGTRFTASLQGIYNWLDQTPASRIARDMIQVIR